MQQPNAACTRGRFVVVPLCKTCAQDSLDTVQLALVVFFPPSTSANTTLALMVVIANCAGGVFPRSTSAFTNAHIATCTVWCRATKSHALGMSVTPPDDSLSSHAWNGNSQALGKHLNAPQ